MDSPRKLRGVQFISFADLARDVAAWSLKLPDDISLVVGIPRSGLTVAHMLAAEVGIPAVQLHAREFRQSSGRRITRRDGKILVVDDTASFGTAMREAKAQLGGLPAYFGVVYARSVAYPLLDFWHKLHAEPDWLVITQWNLFSHQDSRWIVVEEEALTRRPLAPMAGVVSVGKTGIPLEGLYGKFPDAALMVTRTDADAQRVAAQTGRATLSVETWSAYNSGWPAT